MDKQTKALLASLPEVVAVPKSLYDKLYTLAVEAGVAAFPLGTAVRRAALDPEVLEWLGRETAERDFRRKQSEKQSGKQSGKQSEGKGTY